MAATRSSGWTRAGAASMLALAALSGPLLAPTPRAVAGHREASESFDLDRPQFVTLADGRKIHFVCFGEGAPTVVFESGGEGSVLSWRKVGPALSRRTRVCVHDRAGMGLSDPPTDPVTALSATDEVREVLDLAGVRGPIVLVGHSIGGFYATVFADRIVDRVAGLVLLDPGFAGQVNPRPPESLAVDREHIRAGEAHLLDCAGLARSGRQKLGDEHGCIGYPAPQTTAERAYLTWIVTHPAWYETEYNQSRNFFLGDSDGAPSEDTLQERAVARPFGDLPMIVLSASDPPTRTYNPPEQQRAQVEDWHAGHRALAARSTRGEWRLVPDSGHYIALDKPEMVIAAVDAVLKMARAKGAGRAP